MSAKNLIPSLQPTEIRQPSIQHLSRVKSQTDEELSKLEATVGALKLAISKYCDSLDNLEKITVNANGGEEVVMKLSSTLYVKATLADSKALVYVGGGYRAKMDIESAKSFFQRKIDFAACKIKQISSEIREKKGIRLDIAAAIKKII